MTTDTAPPLPVTLLPPDYRRAIVSEPLCVLDAEGREHHVPKGFVTDFASIPRFLWRLLPPWGEYSPAAVVHDYYYAKGRPIRSEADLRFLSIMRAMGVPPITRTAMYAAVRSCGWHAWNKHRKKREVSK